MDLSDTSSDAEKVRIEVLRVLSGEQRLLTALEMSDLTRELACVRILREHPEWTEHQVIRELLRIAFLPAPLPSGLISYLESWTASLQLQMQWEEARKRARVADNG